MIDLHTHILYGIDDGAKDRETTLKMLRIAQDDGITGIVATPHFICGANRYDMEALKERYRAVEDMIKENGIGIELYLGNELFLDEYLLENIKSKQCHTLAGTRYALVEMPFVGIPRHVDSLLYKIMEAGYIPVIAHVERYRDIQKDLGVLYRFLEMGCVAQVNSTSIRGIAGKKVRETAKEILLRNMGHLVASDCHSDHVRSPQLRESFEIVKNWLGEDQAKDIYYARPEAILQNRILKLSEPVAWKKRSFFSRLIRSGG